MGKFRNPNLEEWLDWSLKQYDIVEIKDADWQVFDSRTFFILPGMLGT